MYDLLQIFPMPGGPIITPIINSVTPNMQNNAVPSISKNSNTPLNNELININNKGKSIANKNSLIGKSSTSNTPFILTFNIYNWNVHTCMVDVGASSNVMPLAICKRMITKYT